MSGPNYKDVTFLLMIKYFHILKSFPKPFKRISKTLEIQTQSFMHKDGYTGTGISFPSI